jgi:aminoglycoside phosphotransferase (APT) family kinase protein
MGEPGEGFPWHWSIYEWLEGESASLDRIADPGHLAITLAEFIAALRRIDASGGPPPSEHNFYRGVPLALRDDRTRSALEELHGIVDVGAATAVWEAALAAPAWQEPPVWIHGDLQAGNLLAVDGRLSAVIDFGGLGVGDPACDLIAAWNLLPAEARGSFRRALRVDDASWARGRGWALSIALIGLPYYLNTNPDFVEYALHTIDEVLNSRGGE